MKVPRVAQVRSFVQPIFDKGLLGTTKSTNSLNSSKNLLSVAVSLILGSVSLVSADTMAEEKKSFTLETIKVTARNREEVAQKVPLPVTVVGGKTLDRDNIVSVNDLVKKIPSLGVFGSNPRQTSISLRGIGKNAANDTMEPSVGVIVDGVVSSYVGQSWNDFIDLDRIEVIRGPQGTLLGKNTTLGVVNIVTKAPSFTPGYAFEARYGEYNELGGKVSGTAGIIDNLLAYRGSIFFNKKDGVLDNVWQSGPETWNETNRVGGRLQFLVTPSDTLSARIILDSLQSVENGNKSLLVSNGPSTFANGEVRTTTFQSRLERDYFNNPDGTHYQPMYGNKKDGNNKIEDSQARPQRTEQNGISAEIKKTLSDEYTLTSITAYRKQHFDIKNGGVTRFDIGNGGQQLDNDQISQELRLNYKGADQYDYQVGLYYLDASVYSDDPTYFGSDAGAFNASNAQYNALKAPKYRGLLTDSQRGVYRSYVLNPTTQSIAAFGQVNWHFTDQATLTLGLRDTQENKTGRNRRELDRPGVGLTNATGADNTKSINYGLDLTNNADLAAWNAAKALYRSAAGTSSAGDKGIYDWVKGESINDNSIAWLISPSYQLTNDLLIYSSLSSGEKSGAVEFNTDSASPNYGQPQNVNPEKADNAELGFKSLLVGRRLLLNANLYYTKLTDYQSNLTLSDETQPTGLRTYLGNIPGVTAKGVEFETLFAATAGLNLNISGAYNRATYDEFFTTVPDISSAQLADYSGKQLHGAPKLTLSYGLDWTGKLGQDFSLNLFVSNAYRSSTYLIPSQSEFSLQKSYNVTDGGIGIENKNGKYKVSLIVKNIFDEYYQTGANTYSGTSAVTEQPGYGRAVSVSFRSNL